MNKVFVDSSVLFTAVNSPTGGSAKLFTFQNIRLVTSVYVLTEVERNIRKKLHKYHLDRFFMLVGKMKIYDQKPDKSIIKRAKKAIVDKDAIILAEAKLAKTEILVTLDKKHFLKTKPQDFMKPTKIMTPKMLISLQLIEA